jgi:phenylpyruvate tautomerase PptA (4-oxalocrotonate tautomerase family)
MPLVQVFTSAPAPTGDAGKALLGDLSKLLAARFGKPERWVMTSLQPNVAMTFGGTPAAAAFVAVKNVGKMTADDTETLSGEICERLANGLGVARDRIYIEFADAVGYLWGWDGGTFG